MKKSYLVIIINTLLISALLFAVKISVDDSKMGLKGYTKQNHSFFSTYLFPDANINTIVEKNNRKTIRNRHHFNENQSNRLNYISTAPYPYGELTEKNNNGRRHYSIWTDAQVLTTTNTNRLISKVKSNKQFEYSSNNSAVVTYFGRQNRLEKSDVSISANNLAYNQTISQPQLTIGGGGSDDEDSPESGGGNDNENGYNDVPVGNGVITMGLLAVLYSLILFAKQNKQSQFNQK
ncbi:MAG: hypothetical protein QM751_15625 [Paludibacteraceae bacterium]